WPAVGEWAGTATREDAVPLGRFSAKDVLPGMSGAPVRREADDVGVGGLGARDNSADGGGRGTAWAAPTEGLLPLLAGIAEVELAEAPLGAAADLVLSIDAAQVRLTGAGVEVSAAHAGVREGLRAAVQDAHRSRQLPGHVQRTAVTAAESPTA